MCNKDLKTGEVTEAVIKIGDIETKQERVFSYKKDCVKLNFQLRIDEPEQLTCFAELLELALKDVREQLEITRSKTEKI